MDRLIDQFARPGVALSTVVLTLNDALLKAWWPGWVTGKLSDVAGLFLVGAVLARIRWSGWILALAFATWKSPLILPALGWWNASVPFSLARTPDYSDLLALVVIPLAARYGARPYERRGAPVPRMGALLLGCFAIAATSRRPTLEANLSLSGSPDSLSLTLTRVNEPSSEPRISQVLITACDEATVMWGIQARHATVIPGAAPMAALRYGVLPTGFTESNPVRRLGPGCYRLLVFALEDGDLSLEFRVTSDGRLAPPLGARDPRAR